MTARALTWTATAQPKTGAPVSLPVMSGSITVDSTRNPQVSASLTLPHDSYNVTKAFDPFTRSPVFLDIRQTSAVGDTLASFAKPSPGSATGTLATLDWSAKASAPIPLEDGTASTVRFRRLKMYVTDVSINETAGTFDVQLASADYLLTELVNYGQDWWPPVYNRIGDIAYSYLNHVWNQFFQQYKIPLQTSTTAWEAQVENLEPWKRGEDAWSYLTSVRSLALRRYVLNTTTGRITFPGYTVPAYAPIDRANATNVTAKRSVDNALEGLNQYADGVQVRWVDRTEQDRPDAWQGSYYEADWRLLRRTFIETRDMPAAGSLPSLATTRVTRMYRFKRITTVTIPHDPLAAPFCDLSEHPRAESVQSITFDYETGDVTTTYLEAD